MQKEQGLNAAFSWPREAKQRRAAHQSRQSLYVTTHPAEKEQGKQPGPPFLFQANPEIQHLKLQPHHLGEKAEKLPAAGQDGRAASRHSSCTRLCTAFLPHHPSPGFVFGLCREPAAPSHTHAGDGQRVWKANPGRPGCGEFTGSGWEPPGGCVAPHHHQVTGTESLDVQQLGEHLARPQAARGSQQRARNHGICFYWKGCSSWYCACSNSIQKVMLTQTPPTNPPHLGGHYHLDIHASPVLTAIFCIVLPKMPQNAGHIALPPQQHPKHSSGTYPAPAMGSKAILHFLHQNPHRAIQHLLPVAACW